MIDTRPIPLVAPRQPVAELTRLVSAPSCSAARVMLLCYLLLVALSLPVRNEWSSPLLITLPLLVVVAAVYFSRRATLVYAGGGVVVALASAIYLPTTQGRAQSAAIVLTCAGIAVLVTNLASRLHQAASLEQRVAGLATLQRVSAIVAGHLRADRAIAAIVDELGSAFGHRFISVYLRDGDALILQAQAGYVEPYTAIPLGVGIIGQVGVSGATAFVRDVRSDSHYRAAVAGVVSELCVPIHDGTSVAGILNVESRDLLSDLDRELLELFASQVAVVLRNARHTSELRSQAESDALTDLLNRRSITHILSSTLLDEASPCAVLMLDLDGFKVVNDTYGHDAGDSILQGMASVLLRSVREHDFVARYGGDEFVVVLPGATRALAEAVALRIGRAAGTHQCSTSDGVLITLDVSIGIAVAPEDGVLPSDLIRAADSAMYDIKTRRHC